jgi:hypothetical protein
MIRHSASDSAGLLEDRVRGAELADLVQERDLRDLDHLQLVEPELLRHRGGEAHDRLGVLGRVLLARLQRGQQRLARDRSGLVSRGARRRGGGEHTVHRSFAGSSAAGS